MLARYEISAREFLYPTPTLTGKDGIERELLLSRTVHFTVSQFQVIGQPSWQRMFFHIQWNTSHRQTTFLSGHSVLGPISRTSRKVSGPGNP